MRDDLSKEVRMPAALEIRQTVDRGRGLFAGSNIAQGDFILKFEGWLCSTENLDPDWLALQVDRDLWLCSHGDFVDDCANHSCDPNAGFVTGEPALYALRAIAVGEEIVWDYSTSLSVPGWELHCRCNAASCRGVIQPWNDLHQSVRTRLAPVALRYLRGNG